MLTLTLLRHAKSSWDEDIRDDFARPLAKRGIKAAPLMGHQLAARGPTLDLILCSTAKRTTQTLDLVLPTLPKPHPPVHFDDALYHAMPEMVLDTVQARAETARHIVLIGHNPGLEILAVRLSGSGPPAAIAAMTTKYPTAALAQIRFNVSSWKELQVGSGELVYFLTPRSLAA